MRLAPLLDGVKLHEYPFFGTYPWYVRYAYTGVPWAAPLVTGMVGGGALALDGGSTVILSGVVGLCRLNQVDP